MSNNENGNSTMYAWRKHRGSSTPVWEEVPVPDTPKDGYLVKLVASGVCHSDDSLLRIEKQPPHFKDKFILGHEGCGRIAEVGANNHDKLKVGDMVALLAVPGCGESDCPECSRDLAQLCQRGTHHGIGQDGFYAPYAAVSSRAVVPLPEGISPEVAAVATDAVLTAYHGVTRRAEVKKDETVFLFGLGGLGFNALQIVHKVIGSRLIISDIRDERLKEAARLGVPQEQIVPLGANVPEWITANGFAGKIDTVLDFVGKKQTFEDAQQIIRHGGKILCIGSLDTENTIHMKIGTRKRLSFIFSYGGQHQDLVECLDLIAKGTIQPQVETGLIKDFPTVLQDLCDGKIKARMALMHEA